MKPSLELRSIHLRVSDLVRSEEFYTTKIGLVVTHRTADTVRLAVSADSPPLLTLTEDRGAHRAPPDAAGLFHAALLLPSRPALGRWLREAAEAGTEFDGFSDHGVSEAIYLRDPDGNGLEIYIDHPRDIWPMRNGELAMGTLPLDVDSLLAAGAASTSGAITAGSRWGHLHLRASDLDRSQAFYTANLGVSLRQRFGANARFLAADGYHHHVGLNNWGGVHQPQPASALGLVEAEFASAQATTSTHVRDPDHIAIRIVPL